MNRAERRALKYKKNRLGGPSGRPLKIRRRFSSVTTRTVNGKTYTTYKEK